MTNHPQSRHRSMRFICATATVLAAIGFAGCTTPTRSTTDPSSVQSIAAAVAAPDRPASDVERDSARKPAQVIAISGMRGGDKVAEFVPGGGYFTRIFSKVVGPSGHVYAMVPSELLAVAPQQADGAKAIAAQPAYSNVTPLVGPLASTLPPEPIDIAWTSENYHDIYGFFGAEQAVNFDAAVFRMLKPGGLFIVSDHAAAAGHGANDAKTLHRIDPETVKAQAASVGFTFESQSELLRNPADNHDLTVFSPAIRGHTDQFLLVFRKPTR